MKLEDVQEAWDETSSKWGFYIKREIKRRFVEETYEYLIKVPDLVFWLVSIVVTFIVLALELVIAGVVWGEEVVRYKELLLGFALAIIIGFIIGKFFSSKMETKVHSQISEALKHKTYKPENLKED